MPNRKRKLLFGMIEVTPREPDELSEDQEARLYAAHARLMMAKRRGERPSMDDADEVFNLLYSDWPRRRDLNPADETRN